MASKGKRAFPTRGHSGIVKAGENRLFEDELYTGGDRYGHQGADYPEQRRRR